MKLSSLEKCLIRGKLHNKEIEFIADWIKACAPKEMVTTIPEKCKQDDDDDDDDFGDEDDFDSDEI